MLAEQKLGRPTELLDVMSAVMCTIPSNVDSAARWLEAVSDAVNALKSQGRNIASELKEALQDLAAADEQMFIGLAPLTAQSLCCKSLCMACMLL